MKFLFFCLKFLKVTSEKYKWIILGFILIIAAVLRLCQLGDVPPSPDWDEVALGYNAYSILHTGRDEYGQFLPVVLRSFDDYKPALYTYIAIPFVDIFGLNTAAVRLPSALFGLVTIIAVFFLIEELFPKKKLSFVVAFLLAISPWHIQFSRIAFESNVGLSLNVIGALLLIKALKKPWLLVISFFLFVLSMYVYQSEKVFVPLFLLLLITLYWKQLVKIPKKILITAVCIALIASIPMASYLITNKQAFARAKGVSVLSDTSATTKSSQRLALDKLHHDYLGMILDNRRVEYTKEILSNYLSHYDFNWLFITGDISRHHAPEMGLLYLWELPFLLVGVYLLLFGAYSLQTKVLIFGWFLLAPIPASVTTGVPHAVRTLNFLPTFQLFTALGLIGLLAQLQKQRAVLKIIACCILVGIILFNTVYYLNQYFVQQNYYNSQDWQYGYKQAVSYIKQHQGEYKKIVVSNQPMLDQSYMFFLFYLQYSPQQYQSETQNVSGGFRENHQFGKFEFRPITWNQEVKNSSTLYVGRPSDFPDGITYLEKINYLNGTPAILITTKQ